MMISSKFKYKNYILYIFILRLLKGKLKKKGQNYTNFFKKLLIISKLESFINVELSFLMTSAFLNISPYLKIYEGKVHKKSKRKIKKVKEIKLIEGLHISMDWLLDSLSESKNTNILVQNFFFELCDAFYKDGRVYKKKLDHYQECLNTRLLRK